MPDQLLDKDCVCGRSGIHCPSCGVTNVYNIKKLDVKTNDLEAWPLGRIRGFRCRKCGVEFRETTECTAPQPKEQVTEVQRVAQQPKTRQECLDELQKLRAMGAAFEPYAQQLEQKFRDKGWLQ